MHIQFTPLSNFVLIIKAIIFLIHFQLWPGTVEAVKDIEENIWSPRLGIKGKVDITVQVKLHNRDKQVNCRKYNYFIAALAITPVVNSCACMSPVSPVFYTQETVSMTLLATLLERARFRFFVNKYCFRFLK